MNVTKTENTKLAMDVHRNRFKGASNPAEVQGTPVDVGLHWVSKANTPVEVGLHWVSRLHWASRAKAPVEVGLHWVSRAKAPVEVGLYWVSRASTPVEVGLLPGFKGQHSCGGRARAAFQGPALLWR